ncbi:MAG: hypothetical protein ACUVXA_06130 [Candidatus Jordarchaeum sp.]|uniref:hypothetical protein n=1 Tax=Candidatus Jordarchaeum sp. TaxID=2823881 RepID=UPI00404A5EC3
MMSLLVYDVKGDGEVDNIDQLDKNLLTSDRVLIVIAENNKKIYLWKGKNSPVRKKFVGARRAAALRTEYGFAYKVVAMDETDEEADFLALIGMKPTAKPKPVIKGSVEAPTPVTSSTVEIEPEPTPELKTRPASIPEPRIVVRSEPKLRATTATIEKPSLREEEIMAKLEKIEVPQGLVRELVIAGHALYAIKESKTSIFGKESVERKLERVNPPEGIFLAEDFIPRVVVENGVIQAIEFLKESPDVDISAIEPLKEEMVSHLRDLVSAFRLGKEK